MTFFNRLTSLSCGMFIVVMSACTKTPVVVPPHDGRHAIAFDEIKTKAMITETNLRSFRVWGETASGSANVFNGVLVTGFNPDETGAMADWRYDEEKFWELGKTYDFYAVAPSDMTLSYSDGGYGFEYTMPGTIVSSLEDDPGHVDIVVATESRVTGDLADAPSPVSLDFTHALTMVKISLSKAMENNTQDMEVKSIYLRGLKGSGTYRFGSGWIPSDRAMTASMPDAEGLDFPANETGEHVVSILAVPQALEENQVFLIVEYEYTHGESTSVKTLNVALPVSAVPEWKAGASVTYAAEIHVDQKIQISTPVVEPWGTEQPGGIIIIR